MAFADVSVRPIVDMCALQCVAQEICRCVFHIHTFTDRCIFDEGGQEMTFHIMPDSDFNRFFPDENFASVIVQHWCETRPKCNSVRKDGDYVHATRTKDILNLASVSAGLESQPTRNNVQYSLIDPNAENLRWYYFQKMRMEEGLLFKEFALDTVPFKHVDVHDGFESRAFRLLFRVPPWKALSLLLDSFFLGKGQTTARQSRKKDMDCKLQKYTRRMAQSPVKA